MSAVTLTPLRRERPRNSGCRTAAQGARGLTLDDLIVGVWEGLHADHSVACPVCGAAMMLGRARWPENVTAATQFWASSPANLLLVRQTVAGGEKTLRGKSGHRRARWSGSRPGETRGKVPQKYTADGVSELDVRSFAHR